MAKVPNLQDITKTEELERWVKHPKLIQYMTLEIRELTIGHIEELAKTNIFEKSPHVATSLTALLIARMTTWADKPENQ
jgi:hypothetical protein